MVIVRLGIKNLKRNFRRSLITVLSIGFALAVILWLQSILNGTSQNLIDTITSTHHGHLQIFRKDYFEEKLLHQNFSWDEKWIPKLNDTEILASARVHVPALVSSGEQSMPIVLVGIDPEKESKITKLKENLVKGEFLKNEAGEECTNRNAYISSTMAKLLNVDVGNKIVLLAQAADGTMGNDLFRIQGLFSSGSPDYDKSVVMATTPCVLSIGALSGVHEVALRIKGEKSPEFIQKLMKEKVPSEWAVMTWKEVSPRLASVVTFNDASLILVSGILFVVISLGILNTFLVAVFERTKEFGVMMALGTPAVKVIGTVLFEAFFLGVASSILGIILAAIVIFYHSQVGFDLSPLVGSNLSVGAFRLSLIVYPVIDLIGALKATAFTLTVVVAATLYPAYRASQLRPADAIRSQ